MSGCSKCHSASVPLHCCFCCMYSLSSLNAELRRPTSCPLHDTLMTAAIRSLIFPSSSSPEALVKFVINCLRCIYIQMNPKEPLAIYGQLRNTELQGLVFRFSQQLLYNDGLIWDLITLFRVKSVGMCRWTIESDTHRQPSLKMLDPNPQPTQTQRSQITQVEKTQNYE